MPIGPIDDDGKQYIIIKVTKRRTATKIFRERRTLSELLNRKKYVKFCTSLMGQWLNLLLYALYLRVKTEEIIFMHLHIYDKLIIRLKEPIDRVLASKIKLNLQKSSWTYISMANNWFIMI